METAKMAGGEETYQEKPQAQTSRVGGGAQAEVSDAAGQRVSDGEIENAPQYVDGRRGKSLPGRLGERALKGTSHEPAADMGDGVTKKCPAKKV